MASSFEKLQRLRKREEQTSSGERAVTCDSNRLVSCLSPESMLKTCCEQLFSDSRVEDNSRMRFRNRNDEDDCRGSISSSLGLKDVLILFNWFPSICLTYFLKRIFCETGMKHYSGDLEVFVDTCSSF
ncbi:hypothetical protein ROHU_033736 [Labeo rohita]|uniref:Uncharacterized protein n=1 Tax=Labeo rohita TaxID=84645 RepID=A0A498LBP5_LABRO|nr:hypothetical protein ROHU_033736 [Labeo rohita]